MVLHKSNLCQLPSRIKLNVAWAGDMDVKKSMLKITGLCYLGNSTHEQHNFSITTEVKKIKR